MERLRENWSFGLDFNKHLSKIDESVCKERGYKLPLKESSEKLTKEKIVEAAKSLEEKMSKEDRSFIEQVVEGLKENGADTQFKVWKIPVAKYDVKNLNGRIYPKKLWENIRDCQRDAWQNLLGLSDHPVKDDDPGLFRDQAVIWHDMEIGDDGVVYGICSFVGPYGHLAQEILEHGGRIGTSSSGFGDVDRYTSIVDPETYQVERLADLVLNPSQGTYGSSSCNHVTPEDFSKDMNRPAVLDFSGNHPVKESVENNNIPRSKIFMKVDASQQDKENKLEETITEKPQMSNKLSKVEEKAFRQYVEKFLAEAKSYDNPLKRLNECTDILSCFEDGNCADLKEKVEAQIIEEKNNLTKIVENTASLEKDYEMDTKTFREAAERNTKQAILLNEQVTDYKSLVDELAKKNSKLKEEIAELKADKFSLGIMSERKVKESNKNIVETLKDLDSLNENVKDLKKKNAALLERISSLSIANSQFEKDNGILETKIKEAGQIISKNREIRESSNMSTISAKRTISALKIQNEKLMKDKSSLEEAYSAQCEKFDKLAESYAKYKEEVTDAMDPTKHLMPMASERIGKYLNMRENKGVEIEAYWNDLKEQYGENVLPFEKEIRGAKTLKEATSSFLKHRNDIIPEFKLTEAIDMPFRNVEDRKKIYEAVGMLNPIDSYNNASTDDKNKEFLDKQKASGLL